MGPPPTLAPILVMYFIESGRQRKLLLAARQGINRRRLKVTGEVNQRRITVAGRRYPPVPRRAARCSPPAAATCSDGTQRRRFKF